MKKYKLIKWYPSLPEAWKMFNKDIVITSRGDQYIGDFFHIRKEEVEDNPEYWEEVVKKNYEILELLCGNHNKPYIKHDNSLFGFKDDKGHTSEENCLKSGFNIIKTVKRLSDGEVFTIGDDAISVFSDYGKITKFELNFGKIFITTEEGKNRCTIADLKPIKQPLFTTEDGVDIFEGDDYWFLNKNLNFPPLSGNNYVKDYYQLYFSTKEKAEEYILMNKPCLSITDILEYLNCLNLEYGCNIKDYPKLKKLVESKIQVVY